MAARQKLLVLVIFAVVCCLQEADAVRDIWFPYVNAVYAPADAGSPPWGKITSSHYYKLPAEGEGEGEGENEALRKER